MCIIVGTKPIQAVRGSADATLLLMATASPLRAKRALNLGSGFRPRSDAVNVDISDACSPDIVHDLRKFPWPLESNAYDYVFADDVLEHLPDTIASMEEIHRICAPGAVVHITTPHFTCSNAYTDPTHCHQFGYFTFDHFTGESSFTHYTSVRFSYAERQLIFLPSLKNSVMRRTANRWPLFYERHLCWLWPAWFISIDLVAID
jgi:SAM-dependent methyltransferase